MVEKRPEKPLEKAAIKSTELLHDSKYSDESPAIQQPTAAPASATTKQVLRVSSKSQSGFRRCGMQFTRTPTELDLNTLAPDVVEKLLAEPQLNAKIMPATAV